MRPRGGAIPHDLLRPLDRHEDRVVQVIEAVPVLPFDEAAARAYATLPFKRASYDRLIAAHALSHGLILVTHNEKHFADVPGLVVENWTV